MDNYFATLSRTSPEAVPVGRLNPFSSHVANGTDCCRVNSLLVSVNRLSGLSDKCLVGSVAMTKARTKVMIVTINHRHKMKEKVSAFKYSDGLIYSVK